MIWGILIVIAIAILLPVLFFRFLVFAVEAGFRSHFPLDYLGHLRWIERELANRGFQRTIILAPGSSYPGVMMKNDETGSEIEVSLCAPILSGSKYHIEVLNPATQKSITLPLEESDESKQMLQGFLAMEN